MKILRIAVFILAVLMSVPMQSAAQIKSAVAAYAIEPVKRYWKRGLALAAVVCGVRIGYRAYQQHKLLRQEIEGERNESVSPECAKDICQVFQTHQALANKDLANLMLAYYGDEWIPLATLTTGDTLGSVRQENLTVSNLLFSPNATMLHARLADGSTLVWSPQGVLLNENREHGSIWHQTAAPCRQLIAYSPRQLYRAEVTDYDHSQYLPGVVNGVANNSVWAASFRVVENGEGHTIRLSRNNGKLLRNALQPLHAQQVVAAKQAQAFQAFMDYLAARQ